MWMIQTKIAGIKTEFFSRYLGTIHAYRKFYSDFGKAELTVKITQAEIERLRTTIENGNEYTYPYLEEFAGLELFSRSLWHFDAMTFHAATICVDGKAIAFTAPSGTGKTTHMLLWQKLLGEKLKVINGDKPIIRFLDGMPYVFGSPWGGKEKLFANDSAKLNDICFITRSKKNHVRKISQMEALPRILAQIYIPKDISAANKTINLISTLLKRVNLWEINCNTDIESAEIACSTIIGGKTGD